MKEGTKFDKFVDPNVRDAERRVYESLVIEFFLLSSYFHD